MMEKTLVLIKPDGVQRQLIGRIIQKFEDVGLKIVGMKMVWVSPDFAKRHYSAHVGKSFYAGLEAFITEGPVVAMALQGLHAVELVRKIVGPTEPKIAPPGTIRGDFAHHSVEYTNKGNKSVRNLIHASGNLKEAQEELMLWFRDSELHNYNTVHERHVF